MTHAKLRNCLGKSRLPGRVQRAIIERARTLADTKSEAEAVRGAVTEFQAINARNLSKTREALRGAAQPPTQSSAAEEPRSIPTPTATASVDRSSDEGTAAQLVQANLAQADAIAATFKNIPGVEADDVRQMARIALVRAAQRFDRAQGENFGAFARTVITNALRDYQDSRSRDRNIPTLDEPAEPGTGESGSDLLPGDADVARDVASGDAIELLNSLIGELPSKVAEALRLRMQGMSLDDVGAQLGGYSKQGAERLVNEGLRRLRGKLGERGITNSDDILQAAQPQSDNPIGDLMAMLNGPEMDALTTRAAGEQPGQFETGRPDLARGASSPEVRAVDEWRKQTATHETHAQWEAAARKMLADDYEGTANRLVQKALMPGGMFSAEETKASQMIIAEELNRPKTPFRQRVIQALVWADRQTGTEQARAFGARRDLEQTPEQRNKLFLSKLIYTPPLRVRKEIEAAATPAEKQKILDKDMERLRKIENELGKMGVKLDDIFAGEVALRLKSAAITQNILNSFDERRKKALKLMQGMTKTPEEIAKETGLKPAEMDGVLREFREELKKKVWAMAKKKSFNPETDVERSGLLFSQPQDEVSDAEAEARVDEIMKMMGFGKFEDLGKFKVVKRRKRKTDASPESTPTAPPPSDSPVGQTASVQGDLLNPERNADRMPTGINPTGNTSGVQQKLDLPYEEWMFRRELAEPEQVARITRLAQAATGQPLDMLMEYWINSILSGPVTQSVNVIGNAANAVWDFTVQRGMESLLNLAYRDANAASFGEFKHLARGVLPGLSRGLRLAQKAWATEADFFKSDVLDQQIELFDDFERGGGVRPAIPGAAGRVIRIPGRLLMFMDSMFKGAIGQMEAGAQAYRIAQAEGHKGERLESRIRELVNTPGSPAWQRAVEKATDLTFQTDLRTSDSPRSPGERPVNPVENIVAKMQNIRQGSRLLSFLFPFIRTPYNIFATGLKKTPLGTANILGRLAHAGFYRLKDGKPVAETYLPAHQVRDTAEQVIAWTTASLLWGAMQGDDDDESKRLLITGSSPFTEETVGQRGLQERAYGGPYQVRIGGRDGVTFNYGRYEPFATVIGTLADSIRALKRQTPAADRMDALFGYFIAQAQSKTFLQGMSDMLKAIQDSKGTGERVQKAAVQALVPNLIRQPLRNLDDFARDTKGGGAAYAALPAASNAPQRLDVYGKPVEKAGTSLSRLLLPAGTKPYEQLVNADRLLLRWNNEHPDERWAPPPPPRTYQVEVREGGKVVKQTKEMTGEEYARFTAAVGRKVTGKLAGRVTDAMIRAPKSDDVKVIRRAFEEARDEVREQMFRR